MADHLYRSRDDRMLAGVAGGLAEMWDADPSMVRLVWALLVIFTGGIALLVYIVMAIVVPEGDGEYLHAAPGPTWGPGPGPAPEPVAPGTPPMPPMPGTPPTPETPSTPDLAAAPPTYWMPGSGPSRAEARAARRAARRQRGDSSAPLVIGVFLVLLGGFFLARQWIPELDWDWFWPAMLIALGVVLLVLALGRRPSDPGTRS